MLLLQGLKCDSLPWSSTLVDHISRKLTLTAALKLKPSEWLPPNTTALKTFIEVFKLESLWQLLYALSNYGCPII